jgi:ParB family transcriptional regulator, chromosome partitioning protein
MPAQKSALGKGLSALIGEGVSLSANGYIPDLPIDYIVPNPYQPRIEIKPEKLIELADSIRENGIIEPLIVTRKSESKYELIAGERRWRAAKLSGLKKVPVVIKEASAQQMLELAVVENVQRQDLNALEEALAFDQLTKMFGMTHDDIAKKVGMSRPAVANKVRLLTLPEEIKRGLLEDKISEGHARALLGLDSVETMIAAYKVILRDNLSVRAVEELVRRLARGHKPQTRKDMRIVDEQTTQLEEQLRTRFGKGVSLSRSQKGGKIVIPFTNDDELSAIVKLVL